MSTKLGMNVDAVVSSVAAMRADAGVLGEIEKSVHLARLMSLSPLDFGIVPGLPVLAPVSIGMAALAQAEISNAMAAMEYLILRATQEADQQRDVSGSLVPTDPGWYVSPVTAEKPTPNYNIFKMVMNDALLLWSLPTTAWGIIDSIQEFFKHPPKWVTTTFNYGKKYALKFVGLLPWIGLATSGASTALEWDEDNAWGNTRNSIGTGIAIAEVATLEVPPVSAVIAVVGLGWDIMDLVWDIGDDFIW